MEAEEAFDKIINGVCVVTVKAEGKINGMTAAWYTRVSFSPPLVMVSVAPKRFTHGLIKKAGSFCINILAEDQLPLAKAFGSSSGRTTDKFKGVKYKAGKTGSPILEDTAAYLDCRLAHSYEAGDHTLFVGEVVDAGASEKRPLPSRMEDYS
ncbi:MAG: flavin reductase family protein [Candidatus Altiarchaeota archaeon]